MKKRVPQDDTTGEGKKIPRLYLREVAPEPDDDLYDGIGADLRAARVETGVDISAVADNLRISRNYIEAIEDGRFNDLPGGAYVFGFLRSYAEYLDLDPKAVVAKYKAESEVPRSETKLAFPSPMDQGRLPTGRLLASSIVLAGLVYSGWYVVSGRQQQSAELVVPVPERLAALVDDSASSNIVASTEQGVAVPVQQVTVATAGAPGTFDNGGSRPPVDLDEIRAASAAQDAPEAALSSEPVLPRGPQQVAAIAPQQQSEPPLPNDGAAPVEVQERTVALAPTPADPVAPVESVRQQEQAAAVTPTVEPVIEEFPAVVTPLASPPSAPRQERAVITATTPSAPAVEEVEPVTVATARQPDQATITATTPSVTPSERVDEFGGLGAIAESAAPPRKREAVVASTPAETAVSERAPIADESAAAGHRRAAGTGGATVAADPDTHAAVAAPPRTKTEETQVAAIELAPAAVPHQDVPVAQTASPATLIEPSPSEAQLQNAAPPTEIPEEPELAAAEPAPVFEPLFESLPLAVASPSQVQIIEEEEAAAELAALPTIVEQVQLAPPTDELAIASAPIPSVEDLDVTPPSDELAPRRRQWTAADADAPNSALPFQGRRNFSSNAAPRNVRAAETSPAQIETAEATPATGPTPSTEIDVAELLPASEPESADDSTESVQLAAARRVSELTNGNRSPTGVVRSFPVPPPIPQGSQTAALSGAREYVPQVFGANNEGSRVIIEAKLESWVQVRGRSGETLLTRILRVGDRYLVPDRPNLLMMTGNAAALRIMVDGEEIGPLGPPGAILRDVALEPSQLLARASSR